MAIRYGRGDVKQTTTGFRDPRHHICQKQIPIPNAQKLKRHVTKNFSESSLYDKFCKSIYNPSEEELEWMQKLSEIEIL